MAWADWRATRVLLPTLPTSDDRTPDSVTARRIYEQRAASLSAGQACGHRQKVV